MTQAANLAALGTNAGTTGILPAAGGGTAGTAGVTGFKNRVINGDMIVNQRAFSGTPANSAYTLDRWQAQQSGGGVYTVTQSSTAPAGFINSLLVTVTTPDTSLGTSDYYIVNQNIEGLNVTDLAWGTADAKTVTLSFWVRSSLTGTFGGSLMNDGYNRTYPFSYTITTANTWTQISITVAGDTTGTWLTTNSVGIRVEFGLGLGTNYVGTAGAWVASEKYTVTGAVSVIGTTGATWAITGVQLEVGTAATNFDFRSIGTELALCQRYYETVSVLFWTSAWNSFPNAAAPKVTKRASPTVTSLPETGIGAFSAYAPSGIQTGSDLIYQTTASSGTGGGYLKLSAEL